MIEGKRVIVVITARGGSKGVPRKNLRPVAGKPLIVWTLDAARGASSVDDIIVSSDDEELLAVARDYGVFELRRPAELATDTAAQEEAVLHAMTDAELREAAGDIVVLLAPTNPLRDSRLVDGVVQFLVSHAKARAILTVAECEHHPLRANTLPGDYSMASFMPEDIKWKNRQELPRYYRITGAVCAAHWDYFRQERSFLTPMTFAYITGARAGLDIDSEVDLRVAEFFLMGIVE